MFKPGSFDRGGSAARVTSFTSAAFAFEPFLSESVCAPPPVSREISPTNIGFLPSDTGVEKLAFPQHRLSSGASINDVHKIFGFFIPPLSLV